MKLFRQLILRPFRGDLTRSLLTLISIALGVAVVIAIELAGDAATGSFESSLTTLLGKVDYEVTANGGVDETYIAALAALPLNARFAPAIEQPVVIVGGGSTTVYGIDVIAAGMNETGEFSTDKLETSAVLSSDLAARLEAKKGDSITLRGPHRTQTFAVQSIAEGQDTGWVGIDIAAAQDLLDMHGKLDRIEVFLGTGEDPGRAGEAIKKIVPRTYDVETPGARSEQNRRMLRAFRWNLRILSYISLLVGAFLIYNTIAVSVVRRRTEIGILRAIGTSSRGVLLMFLGEASMLGVLGSVLGIGLGRLLAAAILGMISDTVNALFTTSAPGAVELSAGTVVIAICTGTGVAFFSALIPAREAARVAPAEAMRRESREHETRLRVGRDLTLAVAAALAAVVLCQFGPIGGRPVLGYVATLCAVVATALVSPAFVTGVIGALRGTLKKVAGAAGLIAGRSLVTSLARTSIVVTALATAISMMVAVGIMVGSFRETVQVWLESQLRADIYLRAAGPASAGIYPPMDAAVPGIIRATPGVGDVDVFHAFQFHYKGTQATFGAGIMDIVRRRRSMRFLSGDSNEILASLPGQDRAIVSEPFANKHHVRAGQILRIPLGAREVALTVAGIYYDYANDKGFVLTDRGTLLRYLPDQPVTNIAVYLRPGAGAREAEQVRRDLETRLAEFPLNIAPNEVLRRGAIQVFDRTFAVTYALEGVAIIVATLGAANALLALVLDRRREIGLIRYLGAAKGQVRNMILTEAALLGLLAGLLGLALGTALSLVLIYVVNKQSFGWTIQFHPPALLLGGALLLVWAFTVLAGVYPARFAAKLEPAEVVHTE
ncbi:MAG: putative transport system permease protein [Bryobacterales bacterium]|nr:putative transport system permease protein [Bryobacterales bacterium]